MKQWIAAAKVIRRWKRNGCVTQPQRACRAMRRQAGDMFERSESLTAQALATNSERQATKRPKNVACDLWAKQVATGKTTARVFWVLFYKKVQTDIAIKARKAHGPPRNQSTHCAPLRCFALKPFGHSFDCIQVACARGEISSKLVFRSLKRNFWNK